MFHACPVAYDGTVVGTMQFDHPVVTDTASVRRIRHLSEGATTGELQGGLNTTCRLYPIKEAPFTWSISTARSRTEPEP